MFYFSFLFGCLWAVKNTLSHIKSYIFLLFSLVSFAHICSIEFFLFCALGFVLCKKNDDKTLDNRHAFIASTNFLLIFNYSWNNSKSFDGLRDWEVRWSFKRFNLIFLSLLLIHHVLITFVFKYLCFAIVECACITNFITQKIDRKKRKEIFHTNSKSPHFKKINCIQ